MTLEERVLALRLFVMRRAQELKSVTAACQQLGISRTLFYRWRARFLRYGTAAPGVPATHSISFL